MFSFVEFIYLAVKQVQLDAGTRPLVASYQVAEFTCTDGKGNKNAYKKTVFFIRIRFRASWIRIWIRNYL
jgi:hypothetical protein